MRQQPEETTLCSAWRGWSDVGMFGHSLFAIILVIALVGCETTGNIEQKFDMASLKAGGLVLFSVTHDKDDEHAFRRGTNVKLFIKFSDLANGAELPRAFSNMETMTLMMTTPFEDVWGRVYVRNFAAGRYALSGWHVEQNTGVGIRSITPKSPPPPIPFEVQPGSVMYIGNVHGSLEWGKNVFGIDLLTGATPQIGNKFDRDVKLILKDYPELEGKIHAIPLRPGFWLSD